MSRFPTEVVRGVLSEAVAFEPSGPYEEATVGDDRNRVFRLMVEPGPLRLTYSATVEVAPHEEPAEPPLQHLHSDLPEDVLQYLNPSRYCESDRLAQFAALEFGSLQPDYSRVRTVSEWVASRIIYAPGTTDSRTTAYDVLVQRTGVCRDFAHLAISFCRALGVPSRYVSAYAAGLEPADFHGYFEAYLGSEWYPFDATGKAPLDGLVRIGVGRDAADVSFATFVGMATLTQLEVAAVPGAAA